MSHKINIKKADGSFLVLDINTSINSVFRPSDNKSLKDILTDEYAPKNNPVFTGSISLGRKEGTTVGENSFAVGSNVEASSDGSHAEGSVTIASGGCSHAEGGFTVASGVFSHAEGTNTTASGNVSHAEGTNTTASGEHSHAEGNSTTASGKHSHAEGSGTTASSEDQHVQGRYNIEDTANKYAHIVGNGTDIDKRSNAHTLDWEGNAWYAGEVQATNLPYTVSSKVLATVSASNVKLDNPININNVSINKDRRYYIEFLGSKKLCSMVTNKTSNIIICNIGNYIIQAFNNSTNISVLINKINTADTTTDTFTDLVIYEEEVKYLDSKYLETDLILQNSISLGRVGDIGMGSSAIGSGTTASGNGSHAEGGGATASGYCSHAEGSNTTASGDISHAEGSYTTASGECSHAEGKYTIASGYQSHAEGWSTTASSENQHVQGKFNIEDTVNKYAHIVGNGTDTDKRSNAHTLDWEGNAWFAGEVQGTNLPYTVSSKVLDTVSASNVKLDNPITINNVSINKDRRYYIEFLGSKKLCSLLVGDGTDDNITCGIGKYIIKVSNKSTNISLSINKINEDDTTATTFTDLVIYEEEVKYLDSKYLETDLVLQNSISLGRVGNIGTGSSAIGYGVEASGTTSHAEGNTTIASGNYGSHAEGDNTTASGNGSHAEGRSTTASGLNSHAEGNYTTASSDYQHVQGTYNIEDIVSKYAHIVGNGTADNKRSNAHTLDWKGNAWYAGKLSQEGTPTEDKDLTTKNYVDTKVASIVDSAPETLDTLKELSNALGDDANFATTVTTNIGKKVDKPAVEGTEGQVLSKSADGSNVWVDLSIEENNLNTMLTNVFGFVSEN